MNILSVRSTNAIFSTGQSRILSMPLNTKDLIFGSVVTVQCLEKGSTLPKVRRRQISMSVRQMSALPRRKEQISLVYVLS